MPKRCPRRDRPGQRGKQTLRARHPYRRALIVKRVARVDPSSGACFLVGDNRAESTDSETFGAVAASRILGRVVSTFSRPY